MKIFTRIKGKKIYSNKLNEYITRGSLAVKEKEELKRLANEYNLSSNHLKKLHSVAAGKLFEIIIGDGIIEENEKKALEGLMTYFDLATSDFNFDQEAYNKYYVLGQLQKGILPEVNKYDYEIKMHSGEIMHWGCPAKYLKIKKVLKRLYYCGPRVSIKIMKGFYYRAGYYNLKRESQEHLQAEDVGVFWITNQRIGFLGARKSFQISFNKLHHLELTKIGLAIFKEGKENPYLLSLNDYDVPLTVISYIVNDGLPVEEKTDNKKDDIETSKQATKRSYDFIFKFFGYIFSLFFLFGFIVTLIDKTFFLSFIWLLFSITLFPPTKTFLYKKYGFKLNLILKIIIIISGFVLVAIFG